MTFSLLLGTLVALLGACVSVPQTVRVLRTRQVSGLSITSYLAWATSWAAWAWYSAAVGAWPKFASEVLGLVMETALLLTIVTVAGAAGWRAIARGALLVTPALVLAVAAGQLWGLVAMAVALTVYDAVFIAPQIRAVVVSESLAGISAVSYGLRLMVSLGWVAYGWSLGKPEVGGWGYVIAPFAAYVLWRVWRERRPNAQVVALPVAPVLADVEPAA